MTRESSIPGDDVETGGWEEQLTSAFEILLGHPLSTCDPDAVYATYFGGNLISESGYNRDAAWVNPRALSGAEPLIWNYSPFDQGEPLLEFDASRSLFEVTRSGLPPAFAADLEEASFSRGLIRGADLAPLLERHDVDLTSDDMNGTWSVCYPRIASDGTLFDAMRVALCLGHGPDSTVPFEVEAAEEWARALATVPDPGLREHLSFFCSEAWEGGLAYLGDDCSGSFLLAKEGCTLIANWEEGQCQVEFAVVRLSDLVAGPRPS